MAIGRFWKMENNQTLDNIETPFSNLLREVPDENITSAI